MKILAITQARIGSTRLPEKIIRKIEGDTLLEIHLKRIQKSNTITKLKVATTTETNTNKIIRICKNMGVEVYQGSINNVLERFYETAKPESPDWVVRLTSDCPLIDPVEIDHVVTFAIERDLDYASNTLKPTFPDGIDAEIFKFSALQKAHKEAKLISELEHVTPYIYKNSTFFGGSLFTSDCVINTENLSDVRITVDTLQDLIVIEKLIALFGPDKGWREYVNVLRDHPEIEKINKQFTRNEGYEKSILEDHNN